MPPKLFTHLKFIFENSIKSLMPVDDDCTSNRDPWLKLFHFRFVASLILLNNAKSIRNLSISVAMVMGMSTNAFKFSEFQTKIPFYNDKNSIDSPWVCFLFAFWQMSWTCSVFNIHAYIWQSPQQIEVIRLHIHLRLKFIFF